MSDQLAPAPIYRLQDFHLDGKNGGLHPAEEALLGATEKGRPLKLTNQRPDQKTDQNFVRAEFVAFLARGGCERARVTEKGLNLAGAWIGPGDNEDAAPFLDLNGAKFRRNLFLRDCVVDLPIDLRGAEFETIGFEGTSITSLNADGAKALHLLFREGFISSGTVRLLLAEIRGDIDFSKAQLNNERRALFADRIKVGGSVFLREDFTAAGAVRLIGASITGDLVCIGGKFNGTERALQAAGLKLDGYVYLGDGFRAEGSVGLKGAQIHGNLDCSGGSFCAKQSSLKGEAMRIGRDLLLSKGFEAAGEVNLSRSEIGGEFKAGGGRFLGGDQSLNIRRTRISGDASLNNEFESAGALNLGGTRIGGNLSFTDASIGGKVLLNRARVGGTLYWCKLRSFDAGSRLDLTSADVDVLNMDENSWKKPEAIELDDFEYDAFTGLPRERGPGFWTRWLERQPSRYLSWDFRPQPFEQLAKVLAGMGHEDEARAVRIEKRNRQVAHNRRHAPRLPTPLGRLLKFLAGFWDKLIGSLIDYGHSPGKAVLWLGAVILLGAMIFHDQAKLGVMAPAHPLVFKEAMDGGSIPKECARNWVHFPKDIEAECKKAMPAEYSEFHPLWYSMDVAVPLVNLRQQSDWSPRVVTYDTGEPHLLGNLVRWWEWIETLTGWLLSLLFVSAVGGIIRRD